MNDADPWLARAVEVDYLVEGERIGFRGWLSGGGEGSSKPPGHF